MCNLDLARVCSHAGDVVSLSELVGYDCAESTNAIGKELLRSDSFVKCVVAGAQTGGRGTRDRSFYSPQGGVYMSYLYRGSVSASRLYRITPLAAVAVRRALCDCGVENVGIKWVNDLYLGGKKLCGILTEPCYVGGTYKGLVIGIGINLSQSQFPTELASIATSVRAELGFAPPREAVIGRVLLHLTKLLSAEESKDSRAMQEYRERSILIGKKVTVSLPARVYEATVLGIDEDGGLIVQGEDEKQAVLRAGEVSFSVN